MPQPILSICIPTLSHRKPHLDDTLNQITAQTVGMAEAVEVCVSVNDSADPVPYDENCLRAFKKGTGKYLWLMADDDEIISGSIPHMVKMLSGAEEFAAVYVDQKNLKPPCSAGFRNVAKEFIATDRTNEYCDLTFGGSIILNRRIAMPLIDKLQYRKPFIIKLDAPKEAFFGFIHTYLFLSSLRSHQDMRYGIEPTYGVKAMAGAGNVSKQRRMLLELYFTNYVSSLRKYDWFVAYDIYGGRLFWKKFIAALSISVVDTRYAIPFAILLPRYKKQLSDSGRSLELPLVDLVMLASKLPLIRGFIGSLSSRYSDSESASDALEIEVLTR